MHAGILLRKMVDDIREHQTGKMSAERKAFLFGSHEVNVAAVAYALGTNEPAVPAYGSSIIFETLRDKAGLYYVRVCYTYTRVSPRGDTDQTHRPLLSNGVSHGARSIRSKRIDRNFAIDAISLFSQVLLWTGVSERLIGQTIPGCAELCPFARFLDIVRDVLPNDDEYYCRRDKTPDDARPNHRSSSAATCVADDSTWRYVALVALLACTSKFLQE